MSSTPRKEPMTEHSEAVFELHAGALRLALRPDLGGCIAGLWHRETAVLRASDPAPLDSTRRAACYPLVPYSNRLAYRRFRWKGHDYTTAPNFDASPHSLHGVGWMRPWRVVASSAVDVSLRYRHAADAHWPFRFEVSQHFTLAPTLLRVQMQFTNLADTTQNYVRELQNLLKQRQDDVRERNRDYWKDDEKE